MRKILTLAIIATFGLAAFSACKKSSSSNSSAAYTLTATIADTPFSGINTYTIGTGATITVFSYNGPGPTPFPMTRFMEIKMSNFTGVGTYNFDSTLQSNFAVYNDSTVEKIAKSGAVVITASSTTSVSGTFNFTATDGTVVSNGKFTAKRE